MTTINNTLGVNSVTQSVGGNATGGATQTTSTNSADYLIEMLADLVIGLESQSAGTSTTTNLLPDTMTEPAGTTATMTTGVGASTTTGFDANALATMGQAVGAGMADTAPAVDWNTFVSETQQTFSQAGFSPTDIDTYLGAVMAGYAQAGGGAAQTGVSVSSSLTGPTATTNVAASSSTQVSGAGSSTTYTNNDYDPLNTETNPYTDTSYTDYTNYNA